jgi:hypothetical protein
VACFNAAPCWRYGRRKGYRRTGGQCTRTVLQRSTRSHIRAILLSLTYAVVGERDSALKEAERAIMLLPRGKDATEGLGLEEHLAIIQTIVGERNRAISTLTELLQPLYDGYWPSQSPLRRPFLGSIHSGTRCVPIPHSKNSARKSSRSGRENKFK